MPELCPQCKKIVPKANGSKCDACGWRFSPEFDTLSDISPGSILPLVIFMILGFTVVALLSIYAGR
jgi:hypothetical protein